MTFAFLFCFVYEILFFPTVIKLFSHSSLFPWSFRILFIAFRISPGIEFWVQGEMGIWFAFFSPTLITNFPSSIYWKDHLLLTVSESYFCPLSNLCVHVNLVLDTFLLCICHIILLLPCFLNHYRFLIFGRANRPNFFFPKAFLPF